tara:strand:- start:2829 stop:3068 length:240 start_codon:yes stop_codon:yes gene_type:complete
MTKIFKGAMYEIIDFGDDGVLRLYCENISSSREEHILANVNVEYTVQSRCNEQFDGALILDFSPEDCSLVKLYFGDRDE